MPRHALHQDIGADRRPPTEFRIFNRGVVRSLKGDFLFDDQAAALVMGAADAHGVDFMIDYDHHALHTGQGVQAIAAGWFRLALRDDGLYAVECRWTPKAEAHLRAGEYRYFSPLFDFDSGTGRITALLNTALTNTPALHGLEALVAASATRRETAAMKPSQADPRILSRVLNPDQIAAFHKDASQRSEQAALSVALRATPEGRALLEVAEKTISDPELRAKFLAEQGLRFASSGGDRRVVP